MRGKINYSSSGKIIKKIIEAIFQREEFKSKNKECHFQGRMAQSKYSLGLGRLFSK